MDYSRAFGFVFEDKDWIVKVLIGGLLYLLGFFIIPIFFAQGYLVELEQRVAKGDMSLPEWDNWSDKFRKGISLSIALLGYALPAILLILVPVLAIIIISAVSGGGNSSDGLAAVAGLLVFVGYALAMLYSLAMYLVIPAVVVQYGRTEQIGACFRFKEIFGLIKVHFTDILILAAFMMVAGFIANIGLIALLIGAAFTAFYSQLMLYNLYGQFSKKLEEKS